MKRRAKEEKRTGKEKGYLRNTTPEIGEKCISDGEDEIVLLCRIPVLLVPIKKKRKRVILGAFTKSRNYFVTTSNSSYYYYLRKCWGPRSLY